MQLVDYIVIFVILLILALAALYVIKAKKNGEKCIGCPHSKQCRSKNKGCSCGK